MHPLVDLGLQLGSVIVATWFLATKLAKLDARLERLEKRFPEKKAAPARERARALR
jgi:hypothetical protein